MNKPEALNKKIYYVAPLLHSTMPVGRMMQKGPRNRHLAAEACTTMSPPTRERFRFLLGPPLALLATFMCVTSHDCPRAHLYRLSIICLQHVSCAKKILREYSVTCHIILGSKKVNRIPQSA
jgi:hypothetical protein